MRLIDAPYILHNQFLMEDSLPRYLALALFESMYPQLDSSCVSKYENQWGEVCSIATRLLNAFDRDNVHLIRRMNDKVINTSYDLTKQVGMHDNWNVITHGVRIPYNAYEERILDYARIGVATEFVRHFMLG